MSKKTVPPAAGGSAEVRPSRAKKRVQRETEPKLPTKYRERIATGQKDFTIVLAPTKARDGWVATFERAGEPIEDLRVEAPLHHTALKEAFAALGQRYRRGLTDNVAVRFTASAPKRQAIERVQPASNACSMSALDAELARRKFLKHAREAVRLHREDGITVEDLASITLSHPSHVRQWLADDSDEEDRYWEDCFVAEWLVAWAVTLYRRADQRAALQRKAAQR